MTRTGSSLSRNYKHCCVVCFREHCSSSSPEKDVRQPGNPRKVFKVCSSYLRPEVYTKYSKWDQLTDAERQNPFCFMCSRSGEKLSAMNDKLEEIQREIKSFLKYFVKEIRICRNNEENEDSEGDEGQTLEEEHTEWTKISVDSDKVPHKTFSNDIKQEMQEACFVSDVEYCTVSGEEENHDDNNHYIPGNSIKHSESIKEGVSTTKIQESSINSKWRELQISPEEVEEQWSYIDKGKKKSKWITTTYYYCKVGGKKWCPVRFKKTQKAGNLGCRYYYNGESHIHDKRLKGVPKDVEHEIQQIYEENPEKAKPSFIMGALELKGMEIEKVQLSNLLTKLRKLRLKRLGLLPSNEEREKSSSLPTSGQKRKRGRPPGAVNKRTRSIASTPSSSYIDRGNKLESHIMMSHPHQEHIFNNAGTDGHGQQIQPTVTVMHL